MKKCYHRAQNWTNSMKRVSTIYTAFPPSPMSLLSNLSSLYCLRLLSLTFTFLLIHASTFPFIPLHLPLPLHLLSLSLTHDPLHFSSVPPPPFYFFHFNAYQSLPMTSIKYPYTSYQIIAEVICNNAYHNILLHLNFIL